MIGRVVAMVDADQGPSAAIAASRLADAQQQPLPGELWDEVMGVLGDDALDRQVDALHLVAAGPSSTALLVFGELDKPGAVAPAGATLIRGQRSDQVPHAHAVAGKLVAEAQDDVTERIELADLPAGPGSLYLICRYD